MLSRPASMSTTQLSIWYLALGKGVYSQLGNMHWKVDEHLKYLMINFLKRKYSLEI